MMWIDTTRGRLILTDRGATAPGDVAPACCLREKRQVVTRCYRLSAGKEIDWTAAGQMVLRRFGFYLTSGCARRAGLKSLLRTRTEGEMAA